MVPALQGSFRLVRETGAALRPNLLNRTSNDEGWLTHLSAGVASQSEIPSANHLHLKGKAKAVTPSLLYYELKLVGMVKIIEKGSEKYGNRQTYTEKVDSGRCRELV